MIKNKFTLIASIFIALLFSPINALADSQIEQFIFATIEQTIAPGEISKEIIIETQDSAGNPIATSETIDLKFYSDSATGEFLNESGNPASTVMNKGWKSRKFFYRDSTSGTHALKIDFTGRDSQKIWSANQQITISDNQNNSASPQSPETAQNTDSSAENTISNSSTSNFQLLTSNLIANAGDNIIALLGQEITFDASKSQGASIYEWNFGDGSTSKEKIAKHKYSFPGKHIITLTISDGASESRDQITASIYPSGVYISEFLPSPAGPDDNEWIEIHNSNDFPVDLSDWKLSDDSASKSFIIPQNTFITAKNYLVFSRSATKIALNNDKDSVRFYYPEGIVIDEIKYEKAKENYSAARKQDGNFVWTKNATPRAPNIFLSESTAYQNNTKKDNAVSVDLNSEKSANLITGTSKYSIVNAGNFSVKNFISTANAQTVAEEQPAQNGENIGDSKSALENKNNSGNISANISESIKDKNRKNMISRIILTLFTLAIFAMMWQVFKKTKD